MKKKKPTSGKKAPVKKASAKKHVADKHTVNDEKTNEQAPAPAPPNVEATQDEPKATAHTGREFVTHSVDMPNVDVQIIAPQDITKYYGDPSKPEVKSYAKIRARMTEDFQWLVDRAIVHGDREAVLVLAEIGIDAAWFVDNVTKLRCELVKSVSRTFDEWPILITPQVNHPQNPAESRKKLELGKTVVVRADKVLFRHKEKLQRQVMYHVLRILEGVRAVLGATKKLEQLRAALDMLSVDASSDGKKDTGMHLAPFLAILEGEQKKAESQKADETIEIGAAKFALGEILGIPLTELQKTNPAVSQLLPRSYQIAELSKTSKDDWLILAVGFIITLTGIELEENAMLRVLGDFAGDFIIRAEHCTISGNAEEFNKLKIELRHNERINKVIRQRIKDKLADALDSFIF